MATNAPPAPAATVPAAPVTPGGSGNIDLMGWDTVFALELPALNASIVAQNTTPASFAGTDPQGGAVISGSWDAWSVTGGEGNGIILNCPIKAGTVTLPGAAPVKLDGSVVTVMITLTQTSAAQQLPDNSAKDGTGKTLHFTANQTSEAFQRPVVQGITGLSGYAFYGAEGGFNDYYQNNLAAFDAVFAAIRLEEEAIEADKQWLKPAYSLYGLASAGSAGTSGATAGTTSAFALLSLVTPPSGAIPQQNFDIRMFDVFATTTTPTNSVFAVSAPLAMQNIVRQAAKHCVMGATDDDFEVTNNGITVTNKNVLNWGNFQLQKDDPTSIVVPAIQPGDFELTLDGMEFHLSISQAAFTTPDGTADVKLTADQYFNIEAAKLSNGSYYLLPSPGLGTNSIRADVTPNKGFEIAMIIESIAVSLIFAFLGASLGEALSPAVSTATEEGAGVVSASAESLEDEVGNLSDGELSDAEDAGAEDAGESIGSDGENNGGKTGMFANKYKVWGGVIGGLFGVPVGLLPQIMQLIWSDRITEGHVPTIDQFATNFSQAIQWPYVKSWQVTGGTFRAAFLLGGSAQ
ncbi:TULIP family P47-like protein [Sphingomonas abietis]|uniref:TULIP family P47-like protein n=1 Tax=Sphingomonas abietis TaxID=3012344 RepID=A0ABY7NK92_9SPHN|nr:TULIP family P47-like protein [Sphingomonas abietis]WBO21380.1 TULIP family P47-like protein [Sphingomonas abietis]